MSRLPASDATPVAICIDCLLPNGLRYLRSITRCAGSEQRNYGVVEIPAGKARCTECHAEALAADLAVRS